MAVVELIDRMLDWLVGFLDRLEKYLRLRRRFWGRFNFARRMEWQNILALLRPSEGDLVCDLACGMGTYSHMMARKVHQVHGIDLSLGLVRKAVGVERPDNCFFECANAERLPFRNEVFDAVFSISSFEHFNCDVLALTEVKRVLKAGGRAALTMDSFSYPRGIGGTERMRAFRERQIQRVYRLPDALEWLEANGFVVETARYLVNSPLSDWFYRLGSFLGFGRSLLFVALFPILYPLAVLSDLLFGSEDGGYVLVVAVRKPV